MTPREYLVTLTYFHRNAVRPGQVLSFCHALRVWASRHGLRCEFKWRAELNKAGALHYHFAVAFQNGGALFAPRVQPFFTHVQRSWPHGFVHIVPSPAAVEREAS